MFDQEFHNARKQYESLSKEQQAKFVNDNHNNAKVQEFARNYARYQAQGRPDFQPQQQIQQSQQQAPQQSAPVQETQQDQPQYQESQQSRQQPQYGTDKQFDPEEQFDSSQMTNPNAQVRVQAGSGAQTGRPDYEDESEERLNELTNNLNAYFQSNPELFATREAFNQAFDYHKRRSAVQRARLDSFRKRKEDQAKV